MSELVKSIIKKWKDEVTAQKAPKHGTNTASSARGSITSTSPDTAADSTASAATTSAAAAARPKVQRLPNGQLRDVKTDNISTDIYDDKVRNSCVTVTYNALASDSDARK